MDTTEITQPKTEEDAVCPRCNGERTIEVVSYWSEDGLATESCSDCCSLDDYCEED